MNSINTEPSLSKQFPATITWIMAVHPFANGVLSAINQYTVGAVHFNQNYDIGASAARFDFNSTGNYSSPSLPRSYSQDSYGLGRAIGAFIVSYILTMAAFGFVVMRQDQLRKNTNCMNYLTIMSGFVLAGLAGFYSIYAPTLDWWPQVRAGAGQWYGYNDQWGSLTNQTDTYVLDKNRMPLMDDFEGTRSIFISNIVAYVCLAMALISVAAYNLYQICRKKEGETELLLPRHTVQDNAHILALNQLQQLPSASPDSTDFFTSKFVSP